MLVKIIIVTTAQSPCAELPGQGPVLGSMCSKVFVLHSTTM